MVRIRHAPYKGGVLQTRYAHLSSYCVKYGQRVKEGEIIGYSGVTGWTVNPEVEYYIVDDWYSQPNENYIGAKFGEITVDGETYTIHAFLRQQEPSKSGTSTFLQIFSVRKTPRQCGHIDISLCSSGNDFTLLWCHKLPNHLAAYQLRAVWLRWNALLFTGNSFQLHAFRIFWSLSQPENCIFKIQDQLYQQVNSLINLTTVKYQLFTYRNQA